METLQDMTEKERPSVELAKALKEIKGSEIELRTIVDALPAHAWASRADGYNIYCNQQWLDYSGFTQETARGWTYRDTIHPDDLDSFVKQWNQLSSIGATVEAEARFRRVDGEYRWFLIRALPVRDENGQVVMWFGTNTDIDDRKKAEALLAGENKILEMVATGKPLTLILAELCLFFDGIAGSSMASVLLVDSEDRLRKGAGPNLPKDLLELCEGLKIGPSVGSCGAAAYRRVQVIVTDTETDPAWADVRTLARQYGLRAGWSTPIFSSERQLLAVFGIHWRTSQGPTSQHLRLIDSMTHLASVAIERQHSQEALRASEKVARGQADTLTRAMDEIARETSFDRIAEHTLRALTDQFGAAGCSVFLWNVKTGLMDFGFTLERGHLRSTSDPKVAEIYSPVTWYEIPHWREAFKTGKVLVFNVRELVHSAWRDHLQSLGIITIIAIPSCVAGNPAAIFGIRFAEQRCFPPEDLELAQALANQAILAMQLTRLSEETRQSAVVGERNRLAREVHDTLAQGLTGVIVQLEAAGEAMAQSLPAKVSGHLERASALARESLQEARRSVRALRPLALAESSVSMALKDLFTKMAYDTNMVAKLIVDGEPHQLPEEWENNLLRIGQEFLTNAIRHSQATEFHGRLTFEPHRVTLNLRDNGIGFDTGKHYDGLGLVGIRERSETMGGKLTLASEIGKGTSMSIALPVEPGAKS
jgi:PAS domain S-box-containing protein